MTIEQTVEIPADHRLVVNLPKHIPPGTADMEITILPRKKTGYHTAKSLKNLSGRWKNSPRFGRDGLEIQKEMRSEWDNHIDETEWARFKAKVQDGG
jgi:hypothetical protein